MTATQYILTLSCPNRPGIVAAVAGCIFEPEKNLVHGDFVLAEVRSNGQWPQGRQVSVKGPYGTTGVYGKEEDQNNWDAVWEEEYLRAVEAGWVQL